MKCIQCMIYKITFHFHCFLVKYLFVEALKVAFLMKILTLSSCVWLMGVDPQSFVSFIFWTPPIIFILLLLFCVCVCLSLFFFFSFFSLAMISLQLCHSLVGWNQKDFPSLHGKFHIGDQLISICSVTVTSAAMAQKVLKHPITDPVEMLVRRLPHAQVLAIRRLAEGENIGIKRNGGTAEVSQGRMVHWQKTWGWGAGSEKKSGSWRSIGLYGVMRKAVSKTTVS